MSSLGVETLLPAAAPAQVLSVPGVRVIDLRSPGEFAEDHLPGARNVPLFDDVERALVGTLYKRRSPDAAFDAAREITARKIEELVRAIGAIAGWQPPREDLVRRLLERTAGGVAALEGELGVRALEALPAEPVVLHCWRGGLRSRSVVSFLRELGLDRAVGLVGGYKAYRRLVLEELEAWRGPQAFCLRGLTGVGKTLVLRALEELRPGWTVDLEGLAAHRSSILGMVGLRPVPQKRFESRLAARLRAGFAGPVVYEGESRRVGDAILPLRVWESLCGATNLLLSAPLERRVEVLIEDYLAHESSRDELRRQLPFIEKRLGPRRFDGALVALLDAGRDAELVECLLERYYDPLYTHSEKGKDYAFEVDTSDPEAAARAIAAWVEERPA